MTIASKSKSVLAGMIFGLAAYFIYSVFFTFDNTTASAVGWIYFVPQFIVFGCADQLGLSDMVVGLSCYVVIAIFYGYIAISFRLWPKTAITAFIVAAIAYLSFAFLGIQFIHLRWLDILSRLVFWPAYLLSFTLTDAGIANIWLRIPIDCGSVAFWYAMVICGEIVSKRGQAHAENQPVAKGFK